VKRYYVNWGNEEIQMTEKNDPVQIADVLMFDDLFPADKDGKRHPTKDELFSAIGWLMGANPKEFPITHPTVQLLRNLTDVASGD
jgi:hypothetical protein